MCAGTVVEPPGLTSAEIVSVTSRSRSVALKASFERSALISTLARIGIVLRRSTTRWTWPSDFRSCARSTVTFMLKLARSPRKHSVEKSRAAEKRAAAPKSPKAGSSSRYDQSRQGRARWRGWPPDSRDWEAVPHDLQAKAKAAAVKVRPLAPLLSAEALAKADAG